MRKRALLESIFTELQAIRALLEAGPPPVSTSYNVTTSGFGSGGGAPAQMDLSWDPGKDKLQEMLKHPEGELASSMKDIPVTKEQVHLSIQDALRAHDDDLLRQIRNR